MRTGAEDGERSLLYELADGRFHSGEALAEQLGLSRARLWQFAERLRGRGYDVDAVRGRGYRWSRPHGLLEADRLCHCLPDGIAVAVHWSVDSTNRVVADSREHASVCFAEHQSAGRGRVGRGWSSAPGGFFFSVGWYFDSLAEGPQRLGPWVAIELVDCLRALGAAAVQAKWPNDLVTGDGKLGGILIELAGDPFGRCHVCVGVGINWLAPIVPGRETAGLASVLGGGTDRTRVATDLAASVLRALDRFPHLESPTLQRRWDEVDALRGHIVTLSWPDGEVTGPSAGIDDDGALRIRTVKGIRRFHTGETRLRRRS